jgi:hypothetical protein
MAGGLSVFQTSLAHLISEKGNQKMKVKDPFSLPNEFISVSSIGEYFATAETGGVVDVALVLDAFLSPISRKIVFEVKEGTFSMYPGVRQAVFRTYYLDIGSIMNCYRYADEKQIERFKKLQADELKPLIKRFRKKKEKN